MWVLPLLTGAVEWVWKGSYRTAWAVPCGSSCSCSYSYGRGPAIGSHPGERCWPLPAGVWRAIVPLLKPWWCAEGEVPTAANLNLYRGKNSCVRWHCDDEPLFGRGQGTSKLIVSVSFGSLVSFKWKAKSCLNGENSSCSLGHGDILVMDGQCQDEFLHCTDPGLEQERINVTFRWIKRHTASGGNSLLFTDACAGFFICCCYGRCWGGGIFWALWVLLGVLCIFGVLALLVFPLMSTGLGLRRCAYRWTRPSGGGRWSIPCVTLGEFSGLHKSVLSFFRVMGVILWL